MKRTACVLALGALALLAIGPAARRVARAPMQIAPRCAPLVAGGEEHKRPKASALAPRHNGGSHVYGVPIQQPIFRSRPKPKSTQPPAPADASPPR